MMVLSPVALRIFLVARVSHSPLGSSRMSLWAICHRQQLWKVLSNRVCGVVKVQVLDL